jgi:hypothetical protein
MSRNRSAFALLLAFGVSLSACEQRPTRVALSLLESGHTLIRETWSATGWGEVSVRYIYLIQWANGAKEELPFGGWDVDFQPMGSVRVAEASDTVFLLATSCIAVRRGSKSSRLGPWHMWEIWPSKDLFDYMLSFAQASDARSVDLVTERRAAEPEPIRRLRYRGTGFLLDEVPSGACWLPYVLATLDVASREAVFKIARREPRMPEALVFRGSADLLWFTFDRPRSQAVLRKDDPKQGVRASVMLAPRPLPPR